MDITADSTAIPRRVRITGTWRCTLRTITGLDLRIVEAGGLGLDGRVLGIRVEQGPVVHVLAEHAQEEYILGEHIPV
jgi:hypothetical protein